jgi:DNA topoisomerase IB
MPRLRTVSTQQPGWTRVRHGRGFRYLDQVGRPLEAGDIARVKALVIPPAWRDVWISPYPNGHLQAVGTDDAGRRQYLYHEEWRRRRDEAKFDRVIEMAAKLPDVRRQLRADLAGASTARESCLAAAVRLIDLGCFRLGSESSVEEHGSYGLTTLERRHVTRCDDGWSFCFVGKAGVEHRIELVDPDVCAVVEKLRRRRGEPTRLLCHQDKRRWIPLQPADVNEHIRDLFGLEVTAKDFRTWHATVHVAAELGRARRTSRTARTKAVRAAVVSASELLGNTPTVCRSSYVDPRVIDLYESEVTIADALADQPADPHEARDHLDRAVVDLLAG